MTFTIVLAVSTPARGQVGEATLGLLFKAALGENRSGYSPEAAQPDKTTFGNLRKLRTLKLLS